MTKKDVKEWEKEEESTKKIIFKASIFSHNSAVIIIVVVKLRLPAHHSLLFLHQFECRHPASTAERCRENMMMMIPSFHHWNCFLSEMCLHTCIIILLTILCPWTGPGGGGSSDGYGGGGILFASAQGAVGLANRGYEKQHHTPPAIFTTSSTATSPSSMTMVTPTNPLIFATSRSWSTGLTSSGSVSGTGGDGGESTFNETIGTTPTSTTPAPPHTPKSSYSVLQMVVIAWVAGCLGLLTVVGNILVMVSFKIDKQLQTISNYFLFSLAVADFIIGLVSMPLFIVYLLMGYWPFGPTICDAWLALDYLASNASVLNLLIISFDRYFSVTRPLTYRWEPCFHYNLYQMLIYIILRLAWFLSLLLPHHWAPPYTTIHK